MAANIVDELLVLLRLDTSEYKKADKEIDKAAANTEKKLKKTDDARNKRMKESSQNVKQFAGQMRSLALTVGSLLGLGGGAAGLVQAVVALANFETGLRRASVSTGLSNREMQAWGSAARRLGADAESGRAAVAALAKEKQQFHLTGNAPTMQAFARMGINVSPDADISDILANAQRVYRGSSKAQQGQIEAGLSASGVSDDLILMIRSEKNVREEFARSYAESATENRKALDSVTSALESAKNSALGFANTLATALEPQIKDFQEWLNKGASELSAFNDKVIKAGGGVDGFMRVLDKENPELAKHLRTTGEVFKFLGEVAEVVVFGFRKLAAILPKIVDWIDEKVGAVLGGPGKVKGAISDFGEGVAKGWRLVVGESRNPASGANGGGGVMLTPEAKARLAAGEAGAPAAGATAAAGAARAAPRGSSTQSAVMQGLIARGLTVDQAAAVAANIKHESNYDPAAYNPAGGGIGAHGLFQLRGDRARAFQARYGKLPSQATLDEQLDFFMSSDPEERRSRNAAFAAGGTASQLGTAVSAKYERHGSVAEDLRRGQTAANIAAQYNQQAAAGPQININGPVTVQANDPKELMGGIQRVGGATNYNSAVR